MAKDVERLINVAAGREKADFVLKNANVVNVFTGEILPADVAVAGGYIAGVGRYNADNELDCTDRYLCPGFVDAHIHIESTMVLPGEFVRMALPSGTTTVIADPHEIVNVCGAKAMQFMLDAGEGLPCNLYFMLPSAVPSTPFETAGGTFTAEEMKPFLADPRVIGLGEAMAYTDVVAGRGEVMKMLELVDGRVVDGHAPGLSGDALQAYAAAGVRTEHEGTTFAEAVEKARSGMAILVREGSAAHNLAAIVGGLVDNDMPTDRFMFCTDDKHLDDLHRDGHIRWNVKLAIELGMKPVDAIRMASWNAACVYGLRDVGAVAAGYKADLVLLSSLKQVEVERVYKDGIPADVRLATMPTFSAKDESILHSVHAKTVAVEDLQLPVAGETDVMEMVPYQLVTNHLREAVPTENGYFRPDAEYTKLCVVERHGKNGNIAVAPLKGYGIVGGALATTVAHDSHNIIAAGDNDADIVLATNRLGEIGGGYVLVKDGRLEGEVPLAVAGLMSTEPAEQVQRLTGDIIRRAGEMGIPYYIDPFISLSFMALPVIPSLRLTDMGLFDVDKFELVKPRESELITPVESSGNGLISQGKSVEFAKMTYIRPDLAQAAAKLEAMADRAEAAVSGAELLSVYQEFRTLSDEVNTLGTIASIRHTVDTRDDYYDKENDYFDEQNPVIGDKTLALYRKILASPHRDALAQAYGGILLEKFEIAVKSSDERLVVMQQEENALGTLYDKLYASARIPFRGQELTVAQLGPYKQDTDRATRKAAFEAEGGFFDQNREELDGIYSRMVRNRTQQAKVLGYNSFTPLGDIRMERHGYTREDIKFCRDSVARDIVPIVQKLKEKQAGRLGVDKLMYWDDPLAFADGNPTPKGTPEEILAAGQQMYRAMSPETAEFIDFMMDGGLFDVLAKPGKAPGGYCTYIPGYKAPFIFSNFNGTAGDVDVLTHEAGHAFAAYLAAKQSLTGELRNPGLESCEIHSMSMEYLTRDYHQLFFKEDTAKYLLTHTEDALYFLPYGCQVDEFQETVYDQPNLTDAQRNELWLELERKYRPWNDFGNLPFYARGGGWQRQLHIYVAPFYYIDYVLAQTVALEFFMASLRDPADAWQRYLALTSKAGTETYTGLVHAAGLPTPFEAGAMGRVGQEIYEWIEKHPLA